MNDEFMPTEEDHISYVPGRWYMFFVIGGFTFFGMYVCPLGYNRHRFRYVAHLRNAAGLDLAEICDGKLVGSDGTKVVFAKPFPRDWRGTPLHETECVPMPWAKN